MSEKETNGGAAPPEEDSVKEPEKQGVDWNDPAVPVGNAPPMSRWPLAVLGVAWLGWLVFLAVMLAA